MAISEEPGCEVYVNTDSAGKFFTTRFILQSFDVDDLCLDAETLAEYGERLREFSEEPRYYDSLDQVLKDFESFDLGVNILTLEELNKCLERFDIQVYEYGSE